MSKPTILIIESSKLVGKSAVFVAEQAGFAVPADTRVLIAELGGVGRDYPLSIEKLCPVLSYYVVADWRVDDIGLTHGFPKPKPPRGAEAANRRRHGEMRLPNAAGRQRCQALIWFGSRQALSKGSRQECGATS